MELGEALDPGERPPSPSPPPVYLSRIAVQGFRGIGAEAVLELQEGPGLTVVTGRNGCGKSSFAEALELVLTGSNSRWDDAVRAQEMKGGWRNLHVDTRSVIDVQLAGTPGGIRLGMTWGRDDDLEDGRFTARVGEVSHTDRAGLRWSDALSVHLPILTYAGLGDLTASRDIDLYDQLHPMLGLQSLRDASRRLSEFRKSLEVADKTARSVWNSELRPALQTCIDDAGPDGADARALAVLEAVRPRRWNLDDVEQACSGVSPDDTDAVLRGLEALEAPDSAVLEGLADALDTWAAEVDGLTRTQAGRNAHLVDLLEQSIRWRDGETGPCPVCGEGTLDADWQRKTEQTVEEVRRSIGALDTAESGLARAMRDAQRHLGPPPGILSQAASLELGSEAVLARWQRWTAFAGSDAAESPRELAAHLREQGPGLVAAIVDLRDAARARREGRDASWRPVARALLAWLPKAREAVGARDAVRDARAAEKVLKDIDQRLMAERFAPIETRAKQMWERLRQRSHVELKTVALNGSHRWTQRGVSMEVAVDGEDNVALGVMSQGELHSLALSLFLPRLTHESSPFRFLVLDDPVQAMDPYKVDGLARVLEEVAQTRQVVVFTHDARLPEAIRRLQIEATLLRVERGARSAVSVRRERDPVSAYLAEANALSRGADKLGPKATQRVVPVFCRAALEAFFKAAYRRRALRAGETFDSVEQTWSRAHGMMACAALGLYGSPDATDVYKTVKRYAGPDAVDVLKACKAGAHEGWDRHHAQRVDDVGRLIRVLEKRVT